MEEESAPLSNERWSFTFWGLAYAEDTEHGVLRFAAFPIVTIYDGFIEFRDWTGQGALPESLSSREGEKSSP